MRGFVCIHKEVTLVYVQKNQKFKFFTAYSFSHPNKKELIILLADKEKVKHELLIHLDSKFNYKKFKSEKGRNKAIKK